MAAFLVLPVTIFGVRLQGLFGYGDSSKICRTYLTDDISYLNKTLNIQELIPLLKSRGCEILNAKENTNNLCLVFDDSGLNTPLQKLVKESLEKETEKAKEIPDWAYTGLKWAYPSYLEKIKSILAFGNEEIFNYLALYVLYSAKKNKITVSENDVIDWDNSETHIACIKEKLQSLIAAYKI
jgi:hypothetical protein